MSEHPLKAFRESRTPPLTQAELADLLGVKRTTVWRWENGERFPEREQWAKIRELTGIDPTTLSEAAGPAGNGGTNGSATEPVESPLAAERAQ